MTTPDRYTHKKVDLITTKDVKNAVTGEVKKEATRIVQTLAALPKRSERLRYVNNPSFEKALSRDMHKFIIVTQKQEQQHKDFMNYVLNDCNVCMEKRAKPHDWTKDFLYCLVMAIKFKCGLPETPELYWIFSWESEYHFKEEAHHPEHEKLTGEECKDGDILEMAIDRMARNLQFNSSGKINREDMEKHEPTFYLGDNIKKREQFWLYVSLLTTYMEKAFQRFFK